MLLNISTTINGFSVVFGFDNKLFQGEIPASLMPANPKQTTFDEYEANYFKSWAEYITSNLSQDIQDEVKENIKTEQLLEEFGKCDLLTFKDGCYYRLNQTVSLPKEIAAEYIKYQDDVDKVQSLDNFWYYVCLNDDIIRNMIFGWLGKSSWKITNEGMIVAYRNVVYKETELDKFVKESYEKVKFKHKKNPYKRYINQGSVLSLTKQETPLNLGMLYNQGKAFTHSYNSESTDQPRLYYYIGKETSMDRSLCDTSSATCSSSIHVMDKEYLERNGKNYFGDGHTLCVLVNPALITSCPTESGYNKMRTCAIFPVCEVEWLDDKIVEPDWSVIEKASQEYNKESKIDINRFIYGSFEDSNPKFIGQSKEKIKERLVINI